MSSTGTSATWQDVLSGKARWSVTLGDCREMLAAMPDKSVAHVITDPPYDARTHAGARTGTGAAVGVPEFAELDSEGDVVAHGLRLATRWVLCFGTCEQLGKYEHAAGESWVRAGIWDRVNPSPQLTGDRPAQAVDAVAIMHSKGRKRWNRGGGAAIWRFSVERGLERPNHPTPKPLALMAALISDFTDPDDIILDPFCGSGTTLIAALRLGRRAIGCELNPAYHAISIERLTAEENGSTLQASRAGQTTLFGKAG